MDYEFDVYLGIWDTIDLTSRVCGRTIEAILAQVASRQLDAFTAAGLTVSGVVTAVGGLASAFAATAQAWR